MKEKHQFFLGNTKQEIKTMMIPKSILFRPLTFTFLIYLLGISYIPVSVHGLGVNWGTIATHRLPPKTVVQLMKDNKINKVKLFDVDESALNALAGSGIEVMVALPNLDLEAMGDYNRAKKWVAENVTRHSKAGVDIRYVAVGNEPFLRDYKSLFVNTTFPALKNIQNALNDAGLGKNTKATVPLNADVYESSGTPSSGKFRYDIMGQMTEIVEFLAKNDAPFTVNIYPYISLYQDPSFPFEFAFFNGSGKPVMDNGVVYSNVFDANLDTLVTALKAIGFGDLPIMVGEVGWPTDGDKNANIKNAQRFYDGLLTKLASKKGTPLRPSYTKVYIFGLIDEDAKSLLPGNFERSWGIFTFDGQPKFPMNLNGPPQNKMLIGAKDVKYLPKQWCMFNPDAKDLSNLTDTVNWACQHSDCTALGFGSSCNGLDEAGNASYAFNNYFQAVSQEKDGCDFKGLGKVTDKDPSTKECKFPIQIVQEKDASSSSPAPSKAADSDSKSPSSKKSSASSLQVASMATVSSLTALILLAVAT